MLDRKMVEHGSGATAAQASEIIETEKLSSSACFVQPPKVAHKFDFNKQIVSSSFGAIITSLLMTPLDVVKIRLQAQNRVLHKGDCFVYRNGLMDHLCTCMNGPNSWYNRKIPGGRYTGTLDALVKIVRVEG